MNYIDQIATNIRSKLPADKVPDEHAAELFRLYALLALLKGTSVRLEDVHDAWSAWQSAIEPNHESLVPFAELPPEVQYEDQPFVDAILRVASTMKH